MTTNNNVDSKIKSFYKLVSNCLKKYDRQEIFLRSNTSLGYPNGEIKKILLYNDDNEDYVFTKNIGKPLTKEIEVNFMGLHGSSSQLPGYILDSLARNNDGRDGWSLLLDFFNNYVLWIFYDVVSVKNYSRSFEKDFNDKISEILLSILGIADRNVAKTYLSFASLICSRRRPKKQIERVLQITFNLKNKLFILENIPHLIPINSTQKNYVGNKNNKLGHNFITGNNVVSYQTKIGILIKDINYNEAENFFPGGKQFEILKNSAVFLTNNEFSIDLYLKINYSGEMSLKTGKGGVKLGWGSSLGKPKSSFYLTGVSLC